MGGAKKFSGLLSLLSLLHIIKINFACNTGSALRMRLIVLQKTIIMQRSRMRRRHDKITAVNSDLRVVVVVCCCVVVDPRAWLWVLKRSDLTRGRV